MHNWGERENETRPKENLFKLRTIGLSWLRGQLQGSEELERQGPADGAGPCAASCSHSPRAGDGSPQLPTTHSPGRGQVGTAEVRQLLHLLTLRPVTFLPSCQCPNQPQRLCPF